MSKICRIVEMVWGTRLEIPGFVDKEKKNRATVANRTPSSCSSTDVAKVAMKALSTRASDDVPTKQAGVGKEVCGNRLARG